MVRCLAWCVLVFGMVGACGGGSPATSNDAAGDRPASGGSGGGNDAAAGTTGTGGAGTGSGGKGGSGGGTGGSPPRPCNHELDNPSCWSVKDITRYIELQGSTYGGIFDGRYITFPNGTTGTPDLSLHFDTQGDFLGNTGWDSFDTRVLMSIGNRGGVFDGRYVYLTPTMAENNGAAASTYDTVAVRQDTQAGFGTTASWASFNLTRASGTADLTVPGFRGAAFDGRYVYFAPGTVGGTASGKVMRYDTQAAFTTAASWTSFDLAGVDANATGFSGLVFDGRYLYFVPNRTTGARVARYDTQASFAAAGSWAVFDPTTVNMYAAGFTGGVFDGRYVYFAPVRAEGSSIFLSMITRYDTQGPFTAAGSWSTFDTRPLNPSSISPFRFIAAAFDGRFVYFVPTSGVTLLRLDSQADFTSAASWKTQDLYDITEEIISSTHDGVAFDGRYLYITGREILRFDARAAGPLPAAVKGGSFY